MSRRPRLREVAWRRALRERAADVVVSRRLVRLLALSIARWGYGLTFPTERELQAPTVGSFPSTPLRDAYAWADMQARGRLDDEAYRARFERAVTIYDEVLVRHLAAKERPNALLPAAP